MSKTRNATNEPEDNMSQNHAGVCPNCCYCPTCGRSNFTPWRVYYQPPYPYWINSGSASSNIGSSIQYTLGSGTANV